LVAHPELVIEYYRIESVDYVFPVIVFHTREANDSGGLTQRPARVTRTERSDRRKRFRASALTGSGALPLGKGLLTEASVEPDKHVSVHPARPNIPLLVVNPAS